MIRTLYAAGALDSPAGFLLAFLVGLCFGLALERAGFSSSRRLVGLFYFEDMAVVKVFFTAMIVAALGLTAFADLGILNPADLHLLPTVWGAAGIGGALFGVGFAMGGWCPGTAAVGLASGSFDALLFLGGAVGGSMLYNELYPLLKPLAALGDVGVLTAYGQLGVSRHVFLLLAAVVAVAAFLACEAVERRRGRGRPVGALFLGVFSLGLILASASPMFLTRVPGFELVPEPSALPAGVQGDLLASVAGAGDHMEPEELADRLMKGDTGIVVVDVRAPEEFARFHIRGAVNVQLPELAQALEPYRGNGLIVLYSNGMTHPAQARDELARQGWRNAYLLTDGLAGFMERCLKPVSLRVPAPDAALAARVAAWRSYFLPPAEAASAVAPLPPGGLPGLVDTAWLAANLGTPGLRVIDVRGQVDYNRGHLPGSVFLSPESVRGSVGGLSSMLLPAEVLAWHFSLMGLRPTDTVVLVPGDKLHDATLLAMACERLGHLRYALLDGGFDKWALEGHPVTTLLPDVPATPYPAPEGPDGFSVDAAFVLQAATAGTPRILDVRPEDSYLGKTSEEARAGHIPGALNRPIGKDVSEAGGFVQFKPVDELTREYAALLGGADTPVVVHCRTGHQASQAWFVLKRLLGYRQVFYYDASWSEWAARPELPVENPSAGK